MLAVALVALVLPARPAAAQELRTSLPDPSTCWPSGTQTLGQWAPEARDPEGRTIGQWLERRSELSPIPSCSQNGTATWIYVKDALDCQVSFSTLDDDEERALNQLGELAKWLVYPTVPVIGDWWHENLGKWSWTSYQPDRLVIVIFTCFSHPGIRPMGTGQPKITKATFGYNQKGLGATQRTCNVDKAPDGSTSWPSHAKHPTYFPSITPEFSFGCSIYQSRNALADDMLHKDTKLCGLRLEIGDVTYQPAAGGNPAKANVGYRFGLYEGGNVECGSGAWDRPVHGSPGECCPKPGFGVDDPLPPWEGILGGCNGLTVTSEDRRGVFFAVGDELEFELSAVDAERPPAAQGVGVTLIAANPDQATRRRLSWRGEPVTFLATVPSKLNVADSEPRQLDYLTFRLECDDGSVVYRYYDMSGNGGTYTGPEPGFDLEACLDDAADPGLNPVTWVPALVERLQCLLQWLAIPPKPAGYYVAKMSVTGRDTLYGDALGLVSAPWVAAGAMAAGASESNSISTNFGPIPLPSPSEQTSNLIRSALTVLISLSALSYCARIVGHTLRLRAAIPSRKDGDGGSDDGE